MDRDRKLGRTPVRDITHELGAHVVPPFPRTLPLVDVDAIPRYTVLLGICHHGAFQIVDWRTGAMPDGDADKLAGVRA